MVRNEYGLVPLGNSRRWNPDGTVKVQDKGARDGQTKWLSKCGRTSFDGYRIVVHHLGRGGPGVWDIFIPFLARKLMLPWSWFIGSVVIVFLMDWALRVYRNGR